MNHQTGETFEKKYKLNEKIGAGCMGTCYSGSRKSNIDNENPEELCIKIVREYADYEAPPEEQATIKARMIVNEVRRSIQTNHIPNIPEIYDWGTFHTHQREREDQIISFAVFPRIPGENLLNYCKTHNAEDKKLPEDLVLDIAAQVTTILGKMHQQNILHRDIKPENIMWDHQARQVHLVDLGMTSDIDPQTKKLQFPEDENHLIGTFSVMSPEQAKCKNDLVGTQTEFFNLGATLYTLLAGRPPYQGDNKFELMINAQDLYHPALSKTISKSMRQFIQGLMHRRIKKRPSSAQEILDQIKKLQWK